MFEMAAPIQSPAKREVNSVIRFLNAKGEHPAEIYKQIIQPLKMDLTEGSETSAKLNLTPGKYPKENIQTNHRL
jgi:hypothetical protein